MRMYNPPHPGELLREDVLPSLGFKIAALAPVLYISREMLSRVCNARSAISPDLAVRLERAGIGKARHWLAMQSTYDLWQAEHREQPDIKPIANVA